jgi:hypothetical protein
MKKEKSTAIILKSPDILKIPEEKLGIALEHINLKSVTLLFKLEQDGFPLKPIQVKLSKNGRASIPKREHSKIIEDYLRKQGVILYE